MNPKYDCFSLDRQRYLVQEWIEGDNLRQLTAKKGILSEQGVTELLCNLLPVITFVHQLNIVHRDIKPENIICRPDGRLVLVDFGASKLALPSLANQTGTIIGSPEYIAPEQLRGKATIVSDIYSLGVIVVLTNFRTISIICSGDWGLETRD